MQIKLISGTRQIRVALPERFGRAAARVADEAVTDFLAERRWVDRGVRYGEMEEIGGEVAEEIAATYDEERLQQLLASALQQEGPGEAAPAQEPLPPDVVAAGLLDPDWRKRYAALERLEPADESLGVIRQALADANPSVRRLAVVYLGEIGGDAVLPDLINALQDDSAAVRRAAGDCLSDLGNPGATMAMAQALQDPSKLVRWRAARYLYEVGQPEALPALYEAQNDAEFEVALQVRMAIERIEAGKGTVEPAWKKMLRLDNNA